MTSTKLWGGDLYYIVNVNVDYIVNVDIYILAGMTI